MEIREKPEVKFREKKVTYNEKDTTFQEKSSFQDVKQQTTSINTADNNSSKNSAKITETRTLDHHVDNDTVIQPKSDRHSQTAVQVHKIVRNHSTEKKKSVLYSSQGSSTLFSNTNSGSGSRHKIVGRLANRSLSTTTGTTSSIFKYATREQQQDNTLDSDELFQGVSVSKKVITGISNYVKITSRYHKKSNRNSQQNHEQNSLTASKTESKKEKKKATDSVSNLVKESIKAVNRLIISIISMTSPIVIVIALFLVILLVAVSVIGIFYSNTDNSLTNTMNEIVTDYQEKIESVKNNHTYDTLSIEGSAPEWKEIIMAYCGRYSSASAGDEQEIFAIFNDASKIKLKTVFWDMVTISENTETWTETSTDSKGKETTIKYTKLIITIDSLTAIEYAEKKGLNDEQISNINLLSAMPDDMWNSLLDGVNSFSLTGGFVGDWVYYDQTQYSNAYGDDTIAGSGCGPTSFAMVATYLTASSITPVDAIWCGNSYYVYHVGTSWSYFSAAANHFGFRMEGDTTSWSTVMDALRNGKPVISSQRAGIFTSGGHFIVLAGLDSNENVIVYDPNGGNGYNRDGQGAVFTQSQITASGTHYWIFDSDLNQGGNVAELAWRYLRNASLSKQAAAGVIGNMMTECGGQTLNLDPTLYDGVTGTHYGLCQWDIYNFPSIRGKGVRAQLEYLCNDFMASEIKSYGWLYSSSLTFEKFKNMTNVEDAALAFAVVCERPGYEYNNYQLRRQNAMTAYNYFKNK